MNQTFKNILSFVCRFALSGLLLWWLFSKIDTKKTTDILKTADMNFILAALPVYFVIYYILLVRWFVYVKALNLKVPFQTVFRYFSIGVFGNLFLPSAIGGDLIKIYGLCKDSTEKPKVVASVLLDRLSGYAGLVVVASIAFVFGYRWINDVSLLLLIVGLAGGWGLVMAVLLNKKLYAGCCRVFSIWPKVKESIMKMHYDIALLDHKARALWQTVALSCLAQITYALVFYLFAKALHQDVRMIYFLIFVPLISVAAAFPSIGGLGVREAGAAYLFAKVGVDSGIAVSLSLISFLYMVLVGLIGGVIYVITLSSRRVQHYQPDPGVSPKEA
ncbi:MAG: hypothetical protein A2787_04670 [Omnitrophica WOR_2 bacterium RIFCSPHIGHO2_01_FULL_48_9]|nr:MAG: hypothetical protein A3D10_05210 [Omnitrophica WOR_2 bacterium RIFCSPHIGHO2_02_FULL_48_11]OGX31545.1 MAG: hypothetical protein A2787_04670 [Omnitrophica WOR_2 bacterium RIFCSPHIGHO2_01_FULL_48_9]